MSDNTGSVNARLHIAEEALRKIRLAIDSNPSPIVERFPNTNVAYAYADINAALAAWQLELATISVNVKLTYFKGTGKYYSSGEYRTSKLFYHEVVKEVQAMQRDGKLPGLVEGAREFDILIQADAPYDLAHMIYAV